jgi:hypothetical protein
VAELIDVNAGDAVGDALARLGPFIRANALLVARRDFALAADLEKRLGLRFGRRIRRGFMWRTTTICGSRC